MFAVNDDEWRLTGVMYCAKNATAILQWFNEGKRNMYGVTIIYSYHYWINRLAEYQS
jgi:hypothetical protein